MLKQSVDGGETLAPEAVSTDLAQQLQVVWNEVDTHKKGFLSKEELGQVCQHIGMEDMNDEVNYPSSCVIYYITVVV